jgi:hypothetical protein
MTIVKAGPAKWTWSEDVLAFARQEGVEQYLDPLMEATRTLFPTAKEIRVSVWQDPEIAEFRAIAFDVYLAEEELGNYLELTNRWTREFLRIYPATPPGPRFVKGLYGVNHEPS